jgi:hypothetical protein
MPAEGTGSERGSAVLASAEREEKRDWDGRDLKWKYDPRTKHGRFSPVSVGEEEEEEEEEEDEWAGPRLIRNTFYERM